MKRTVLCSLAAGLAAAVGGCIFAELMNSFLSLSGTGNYIFAWGMYLTVVIAVCTGIILSHFDKR